MTHTRFFPAVIVLFLCLAATAFSSGNFPVSWRTVSFDTPTQMSRPTEIGLDAVAITDRPEASHGNALMEVVLVAIPADLREALGNSDSEVVNYVKSTFLGTAKSAEKTVTRTFLGRTVFGELLSSKIPAPREIELYLIPLADGGSMAVAFSRDTSLSRERFEALADKVSRSFRESAGK